jgi:hypothetical protein
MRFNLEKFPNPFKNDPFLKTSVVWGLAILAMIMVLQFAQLQLFSTYDSRVAALVPFLLLLFGAAYMVKFIGARPVFYTAICGLTVGVGLAFLGLLEELLSFQGIYFESFARFLLVAVVRGAGMMVVGGLAGWIMTRGRVPIAIELPSKKEEDEARRSGQPLPGPRIVTPVSAMPGNPETNAALMEQLEKDPTSLMSEHQRRKVTPPVEDRPPVSARNGKRKTR